MINRIFWLIIILFSVTTLQASDHGIYLLTKKNINLNIDSVINKLQNEFSNSNYTLLQSKSMFAPDYVREDSSEYCGFNAHLFVFTSDSYLEMLTSFGSKYLVAGFLKIGIYETDEGYNFNIADPETINRIIFNDLYENDEEEKYNEVITKTLTYKKEIVDMLHKIEGGQNVEEIMEPMRDDEDLAESSRDMFMMVGPLTLFNDENQFPIIYSQKNSEGFTGLLSMRSKLAGNISSFTPTEDDKEYRWYPNEKDLNWEIISEISSPLRDAILLGISRPRTESVSFHIAGSSREDETNMCPGIDHIPAYPIEVLLIQEDDMINIYTQREMHRMDMYFWDAGMSAFMNHMSMPGILDESIKKALLGK